MISRTKQAFTLVELSIVLVILGLLVGGVLSGQALIRAAELRSATAEYTQFKTAFGAFRDKYFALPGDMPNASSYWGLAADCYAPGTGTATCNGNGDGKIGETVYPEMFHLWRHLANAGLIEGSYSAVLTGPGVVPGKDIPKSKLSGAGWGLEYLGSGQCDYIGDYCPMATGSTPAPDFGNALTLGKPMTVAYPMPFAPIFTPEDAYNVDMKLDDGKPNTGVVQVWDVSTPCTTAGTGLPSDTYRLSDKTVSCTMLLKTGY